MPRSLPPELVFECSHNWGHQAEIPSIQGVKPIHVMRNHGDWEKTQVVTRKLAKHLAVRIGELYSPADNRVVFTIHVTTPATVELRSQTLAKRRPGFHEQRAGMHSPTGSRSHGRGHGTA